MIPWLHVVQVHRHLRRLVAMVIGERRKESTFA